MNTGQTDIDIFFYAMFVANTLKESKIYAQSVLQTINFTLYIRIYKTVYLPNNLYGCGKWSLNLGKPSTTNNWERSAYDKHSYNLKNLFRRNRVKCKFQTLRRFTSAVKRAGIAQSV
jgi:hypothetical protein